jgi:hypothetical protein
VYDEVLHFCLLSSNDGQARLMSVVGDAVASIEACRSDAVVAEKGLEFLGYLAEVEGNRVSVACSTSKHWLWEQ